MELSERNRDVLKKKYPYMLEQLDAMRRSPNIRIENACDGASVLVTEYKGRKWFLNSRLKPESAASVYADRYCIRAFGTYFIFGFSDGRCLREFLRRSDRTNHIIVCEPNKEVFCMTCCAFDVADILADDRVLLYIPEMTDSIESIMMHNLQYADYKINEFCILPGYDILYREMCETFMDAILNKMRDEIIGKSTRLAFNRMIPQHTIYHMKNMIQQRNIAQLRQKVNTIDLGNIPAIIVSAGPSLDKNIQELRSAVGKALIIVVDAALRTVLRAGVHPDIVCTIDPESPDRFFEELDLDGVIWCCDRLTRPWILQNYGRRVYYFGFFEKKWNQLLNEALGYDFPDLTSGGSVTSIAFSLSCYLGFRKIILMGQDMAFTNGISHTEGIENAFGDNDTYIQSRKLMQVEGIDGTLLETDIQMWYYKQWFEKVLRVNRDELQVINATEGGAKIEGAQNRTLKDAIKQECLGEFRFSALEKDIIPAFTGKEKEKERLETYLENMDKQVEELEKKITEATLYQKKILELLKDSCYGRTELKKDLLTMMQENDKLEQMPLFDMMAQYAQKEEYEIADNIYVNEEMEIRELVSRSLALYEGYQKAAIMLGEDIKEFV